mmetsp:Transcript_33248/g.62095  ORF Transcript_33248/g.62095 Transcript_33248/m.62095 type:complete len:227 (-) Transcript_33248:36-716(-)
MLHRQHRRQCRHRFRGKKGPANVQLMVQLGYLAVQPALQEDRTASHPRLVKLRHWQWATARFFQHRLRLRCRRRCAANAAFPPRLLRLHQLPTFMSARQLCRDGLQSSPQCNKPHRRLELRQAVAVQAVLQNGERPRRRHRDQLLGASARVRHHLRHLGCLPQPRSFSDPRLWRYAVFITGSRQQGFRQQDIRQQSWHLGKRGEASPNRMLHTRFASLIENWHQFI